MEEIKQEGVGDALEPKKIDVSLETLLKTVVHNKASDLHLVSKSEPQIRIDGTLRPLELGVLSGHDIQDICYALITDTQKSELEENKELDFAIELPGVGRFRGNYYYTCPFKQCTRT